MKCTSPATLILQSHAFELVLFHLDYDQVVEMQAINKKCYEFTIPRYLK